MPRGRLNSKADVRFKKRRKKKTIEGVPWREKGSTAAVKRERVDV